MDEVLEEFLAEMAETLDAVDLQLVRLEADPGDRPTLDGVFRLMHTLKGTCGFIGLPRLEAIAHAGESLLGEVRANRITVTREAVTLVLQSLDQVKWLVAELRRAGAEPEGDDAELIDRLEDFASGTVTAPLAEPSGMSAAHMPLDTAAGAGTIRVQVDLLERLMTMVTELVLTRNQLLQLNRSRSGDPYAQPLLRLSGITSEVQDAVMRMRMQPIGAAWKKLPRLIRDIGAELGKDIRLTLEGEAAELDRQVLELIRDPLTHMVRNAADHGLETPAERKAAGKPAKGTIALSAAHQGGCIMIRIADDGRGLDTQAIRRAAVEKGLLGEAEAEALSDAQAHRLIFAAGFSTAEAVTNLSGRGVGMDVVRANIEQIGGQIDLASTPGQGTIVTLRIPLTLAIISALIVRADGRRFAADQAGVLEVVRVGPAAAYRIDEIEGAMMLRLRGALLPVVSLASSLELTPKGDSGFVLVIQTGAGRYGLLVDEVLGVEEIVVKPLPGALRDVRLLSGATMLGDGSVALILDGEALGELAKPAEQDAAPEAVEPDRSGYKRLLLFAAGPGSLKAVELDRVTRLERVARSSIEQAGAERVLQHRGELIPVLTMDGVAAPTGVGPPALLLVLAAPDGPVALLVDEIVDIVEDRLDVTLEADEPGVLGVAVVGGRTVQVLDLDWRLARARRKPRQRATARKAAA